MIHVKSAPKSALCFILAAGLFFSVMSTAFAEEPHVAAITEKLDDIRKLIVTPLTISAIKASNAQGSDPSMAEIETLESQWKKELSSGDYKLINSVVSNELANSLRDAVTQSAGIITEVNVMNAKGFSIAQSAANSDIWQGEEGKYKKTYPVGPDAVFIDEVEFDDSTQSYQSQLNFSIADPATGQAIGAVSVGISVDEILN